MSVFFGDFALDQERRQLLRSGEPVPLKAKPYELLSLLVARRPRVLSKTQIKDALWPGTVVGERVRRNVRVRRRLLARVRPADADA